jgi:hypothetical protein
MEFAGKRRLRPVPLGLRHRRDWARWGRYCICGLRWRSCPDRGVPVPVEPQWAAAPPAYPPMRNRGRFGGGR